VRSGTVVDTLELQALVADSTPFDGRENPRPSNAALRRLAPLARAAAGVLVVSRHAGCYALLRHPHMGTVTRMRFPLGVWLIGVAIKRRFGNYVPVCWISTLEHTRIRHLVSGVFTAHRLAGSRSELELSTLLSEVRHASCAVTRRRPLSSTRRSGSHP
jgi:cytochrome P450